MVVADTKHEGAAGEGREGARVDAGLGDEPGSAGAIQVGEMPRVALARIDGDAEVRRDALRQQRPQRRVDGDDHRAILQAPGDRR